MTTRKRLQTATGMIPVRHDGTGHRTGIRGVANMLAGRLCAAADAGGAARPPD